MSSPSVHDNRTSSRSGTAAAGGGCLIPVLVGVACAVMTHAGDIFPHAETVDENVSNGHVASSAQAQRGTAVSVDFALQSSDSTNGLVVTPTIVSGNPAQQHPVQILAVQGVDGATVSADGTQVILPPLVSSQDVSLHLILDPRSPLPAEF